MNSFIFYGGELNDLTHLIIILAERERERYHREREREKTTELNKFFYDLKLFKIQIMLGPLVLSL